MLGDEERELMKELSLPLSLDDLKGLNVNDFVTLSGEIITARDKAHKYLASSKVPGYEGMVIYHCGPMMKKDGVYRAVSAGPTTSARMEIFQDKFIEAFHPAIIIGKGGMGNRTSKACQKFGCVYGAFTGGAALLAARGIKKVKDVFWLEELGMPECLWVYEVENFGPMIISIDTHGNNLTDEVGKKIKINKDKLLKSMGK